METIAAYKNENPGAIEELGIPGLMPLFEPDSCDGFFTDAPQDAVDAGNGFDGFERLPAWEMLWQIIQRDSRYAT